MALIKIWRGQYEPPQQNVLWIQTLEGEFNYIFKAFNGNEWVETDDLEEALTIVETYGILTSKTL